METRKNKWFKRAVHVGLSVLVAFHLFCVLLVPAGSNYIGWLVAPYVEPYVRMLAIGSTWGFFSPDPGPPPLVIEFEAISDTGGQIRTGRWPDQQDQLFFRERKTWRVTLSRWLSMTPNAGEQMLGPLLCRENPGAFQIRMWALEFGTPSLLDVRDGKRQVGDEVEQQRRYLGMSYCPQAGEEKTQARTTDAGTASSVRSGS
jgi:hypothetical protein